MRSESIRYLIVPGWQGSPDDHWQSHWQRTLPNSSRVEQTDWLTPRREDWVAELERSVASDTRPVVLVAHSLGCITVALWAAQAPLASLRRVRIDFQPYPFPSYTEQLITQLKDTLILGEKGFLNDLDPAATARDLVDDRFVRSAIEAVGGLQAFGFPNSFEREEEISV